MKKTRKHYAIFLVFLIAALVFSLAAPMYAEAYNCAVHKQIAYYAWDLWADQPWMWEIGAHLGRIEGGACTDDHAEDYVDHVWDYYGTDGECITITHFWDPDNGLGDIMHTAFCNGENAAWKAMILWGMALGEYHSGDENEAYHYLGHVAHLLGDMSVPAHAHDDSHVYPDTYDDEYMSQPGDCSIENAGPPECLYTNEKEMLSEAGPLEPEGPDKLHWLFYTSAQLAGMYASDDDNGNTDLDPGVPISVNFSEFDPGDQCDDETIVECDAWDEPGSECNPCLQVIRNNSYLRSIPATAALYKHFGEQSKKQEDLTVVIDAIQQISGHDDDPDYFVRVMIGDDFWFRNEGSQVGDAGYDQHPVGWAFGRNVGLTGTVEVRIELWDDDVGGYDHSDIYSGPNEASDAEERNIWLTVDLEKCRTGASDAIGYDLTGACGVQLTSEGDDTDNSRIWFRILPPNSPPEANAGPDLTVNEGDYINILGQYSDPDQDDTHSHLWQMVSSTNGQVVEDDIGTVLSFVPCDNGVYTFRYTVTDNHGAWDSDEVVVTVMNVAPVVSTPSISNQPNAEFILPVVHEVGFSGTFTDAGSCDTHTAVWDWSDGTPSDGSVTETDGSGSVIGSHIFSVPGDFTITLTVTDDDGGSGSNTMTIHIADVGEALEIFNTYIQSLPSNVFKNNATQRKKAYDNMFDALDDMLADLEYQGMIKFLNGNIRTTFDGLMGGGSKDDWIIQDLAIQTELCQKVDDITNYLQYLLSNMP